ncbi:MAG: 3-hydroxyacyl-ACP dehydratase FabZ [Patescibacteria group bacterium]
MPFYDINQIKEVLPHRFPFLLVDRIVELGEARCVGLKNFTANEPFSQEDFGGIYPMQGVLQVEAMAQVAAFLMLSKIEDRDTLAYFSSIERARFRRPALPGDQLRIEVTLEKLRTRAGRFSGVCYIDGQKACQARFTCMTPKKFELGESRV